MTSMRRGRWSPPSWFLRASDSMSDRFIGIDPGMLKCGYALVSFSGGKLALEVIPTTELTSRMQRDIDIGPIKMICVGNATTSEKLVRLITVKWPNVPLTVVDERNTTLEARRLYYEDHPPRGLMRLVPRGLLVPKEPLDAYAALLIVRRYLKGLAEQDAARTLS